ncbi:MAG TPA: hypothetical protein DCP28_04745, partial [Cytophagales bacterium]|nr:hypothetical protein [Cytophagales bacterium]
GRARWMPNDTLVALMTQADDADYQNLAEPRFTQFRRASNHAFLSSSLAFDNFRLGVNAWALNEGSAGAYSDNLSGINHESSQWAVNHTLLTLQYQYQFNNTFTLRTFTRYKVQANRPNARETRFQSYLSGDRNPLFLYTDPEDYIPGGYLVSEEVFVRAEDFDPDSTYVLGTLYETSEDQTFIPDSVLSQERLQGDEAQWQTAYLFQEATQLRSEISLLYSPSVNLDVITGMEYRVTGAQADYLTSSLPFPESSGGTSAVAGGNLIRSRDVGLYGQAAWHPDIPGLWLTAGGRLDYNWIPNRRDTLSAFNLFGYQLEGDGPGGYGFQLSPRAVVTYQVPELPLTEKLLFAQAFKDATHFQKFSVTHGRVDAPGLQPEQSANLELTGRWQQGSADSTFWQLEGGVYWGRYTQAPRLISVGEPAQLRADDNAETQVLGGQLLGTLTLREFSLWGNYSLTRSRTTGLAHADPDCPPVSSSVPVGAIPLHQVNVGARYRPLRFNWLTLSLRGNFLSRRSTGSGTTVNPYGPAVTSRPVAVFNGALTLSSPWRALTGASFQVIVNNLLDTKYYHPGLGTANGFHFASQVPQERAHFLVRLRYRW